MESIGCIDNVYVLNYLVNRQIVRRERKMLVLFVDLKAAFDSVDRAVLIKAMRKGGLGKGWGRGAEKCCRRRCAGYGWGRMKGRSSGQHYSHCL